MVLRSCCALRDTETYDCPVCYCFDIRDRRRPDGVIERLRCWDFCQGALCFAIAGGHNPRPTQASRLRQRLAQLTEVRDLATGIKLFR